MAVISVPHAFNEEDLFVDLRDTVGQPLFLKCEGFNFAGSVKLKAAVEMVEAAEREGRLGPGRIIVESSSGNLGVALSMVAANKGYPFLCVTDTRSNLATRKIIEAYGGHLHVVTDPHPLTGFLGARLDFVRQQCLEDDRYAWLNQYANAANWGAHFRRTAPAIARHFPELDVLFVGAGTCGTLMGCARFFKDWHRPVRIVAVDAVGSVTFGGAPAPRHVPGLGMSVPPQLLDTSFIDEVVMVAEEDTVRTCRQLARRGFLFGGSTGTVVSGASGWLATHGREGMTSVAISPDLGERYVDTVYEPSWLRLPYQRDGHAHDGHAHDRRVPDVVQPA